MINFVYVITALTNFAVAETLVSNMQESQTDLSRFYMSMGGAQNHNMQARYATFPMAHFNHKAQQRQTASSQKYSYT